MTWDTLELWVDEEKRIHQCLTEALQQLIAKQVVISTHEEKEITGKLRPIVIRVRKIQKLGWSFDSEVSSFKQDDDPEPIGHPDVRFYRVDREFNDYHYDVECKLVRIKRTNADTDYCYNYIKKGVFRYLLGIYAQSPPPMGTMIGYVQEGDFFLLFNTINQKVRYQKKKGLNEIKLNEGIRNGDVTHLYQDLQRDTEDFVLHHLWADLR